MPLSRGIIASGNRDRAMTVLRCWATVLAPGLYTSAQYPHIYCIILPCVGNMYINKDTMI